MKKALLLSLFLNSFAFAQDTLVTLKVHFLYGSKPAKGHKKTESKWFGGLHGGHVTLQLGDSVVGFNPAGNYHIFPHKKNKHSGWALQKHSGFVRDSVTDKYFSVEIPVSMEQYSQLKPVIDNYLTETPYDYAFFGMRCAAATYDLLGQIGVVKKRTKFRMVCGYFYPKPLRKKIFRMILESDYAYTFHNGRDSRKWEKDKKKYRKKLKLE